MNRIVIILEIAVLVLLVVFNIWMMIRKKASSNRQNIEGRQKRETDLNQRLVNRAGDPSANGSLRPFEERYVAESKATPTMEGGLRVELKVITPASEKKYLTTIADKLTMGSDSSNELILDSQLVAGREAVLIREKSSLLFRKVNASGDVYVERSRKRKQLDGKPFRVNSQDRFFMQDVMLEIRFV